MYPADDLADGVGRADGRADFLSNAGAVCASVRAPNARTVVSADAATDPRPHARADDARAAVRRVLRQARGARRGVRLRLPRVPRVRAALANACFLWVPPFFSVLLQNFGECKGRAPTPFLGFFGILAVLGTFWVSCFLVRPGLLFSYTFFSFCIFCVLFGLASCAKNLLTSFFPSPGLLFS